MIVHRILSVNLNNINEEILFGIPDTDEELDQMFAFRYREYVRRGYIDPSRFPNGLEKDEYDDGRSTYFIAIYKNVIIGTIRLISTHPLPTELDFSFIEPVYMKEIPINHRAEFGRFIIVPLDHENNKYLPKGILMLTLFDVLLSYCTIQGIDGGYSFIKSSLYKKFNRLHVPIRVIKNYILRYPTDGVLFNYFNQVHDPVIPISFITKDFKKYLERVTHSSLFFHRKDHQIRMKDNLWVKLLQWCKII